RDQSCQGERNDEDKIRADENRVAHIRRDARRYVAHPRQRIEVIVLDDTVKGDGKTDDQRDVNGALDLNLTANRAGGEEKNEDVREGSVKPLQALIRTEQTDVE